MTGGEHSYDYDWLVIGSGFGGSVLGASAVREGLLGGSARVRAALCRRRVPEVHRGPEALLLEPPARDEGHLPPDDLQGRLGRLGLRRRRWQASAMPTRCTCRRSSSSRIASGRGMKGLGDGARSPLRGGPADARCRRKTHTRTRLTSCSESSGASWAWTRATNARRSGIYFGERGHTVSDPYFGGDGPDRDRLPACAGRCMGRLRARCQEHPGQETTCGSRRSTAPT